MSYTYCSSDIDTIFNDIDFTSISFDTTIVRYARDTNVFGCDSIIEHTLYLHKPDTTYLPPVSICYGGSYEWEQYKFTGEEAADTYTLISEPKPNKYGCNDSIVIMLLTVNEVYHFYDTLTIVDDEPIEFHDRILTNGGLYDIEYQTEKTRCDSIYHLYAKRLVHLYDTICSGAGIYYRGKEYTTDTIVVDDFVTVMETDSTIIWQLTVNRPVVVPEVNSPLVMCSDELPYNFRGRLLYAGR